jgi:asparagine synthase (glutamine-hydrolysing)
VENGVGLVHRRLSIIDLAGSRQPIANENETIHLVYNGEIYNYRELRELLIDRGHVMRTAGDSEVLVHLWEDKGPDMLPVLNGMFGFALWDRARRTVFLGRDRLGIKPLYYAYDGSCLVFGSEIKAILASGVLARELNKEALPRHLLYNCLYGEETLFHGIKELLPGHCLIWETEKENEPQLHRWWDLPDREFVEEGRMGEQEAIEELRDHLIASVRRMLISDVPVGVFLSGGLDSSILVALASQEVAGPLRTFSIGFREEKGNEFRWSREVARRFCTDHLEILLEEEGFFDALPSLIWYNDEPIKHNNSVPLYFLSRETKDRAKVILTGEGSDELFLGYRKYQVGMMKHRLGRLYRTLLPRALGRSVATAGRSLSRSNMLVKIWDELMMVPDMLATSTSAVMDERLLTELTSVMPPETEAQPFAQEAFRNSFPCGGDDFLRRFSRMDLKAYLVSLLAKQDRMSMAASIESRVPFLDHPLVEWAYRLPSSFKIRQREGKWILKKLAEQYLPRDLIYRPKQGFPVPAYEWFRKGIFLERAREILMDKTTLERGLVSRNGIERYCKDLESGIYGTNGSATYPLWTLLNLELWWRIFLDAPSIPLQAPQLPAVSTLIAKKVA